MERNFHAKGIIFGLIVGAFVIYIAYHITPSNNTYNKGKLLKIGMSKNDVLDLVGKPESVDVSTFSNTTHEYWHYKGGKSRDPYVYFINEKVQSWNDM
jgi:outer membrane protein assembly factor BamE (lipoprotein component of BamABCDE complex)